MKSDNGYPELAAYLLDVLVRNDRKVRVVGPPKTRQEWGVGRVNVYLQAIGRETLEEDGEAALWQLIRGAIALLPRRREEAVFRLVRVWAQLDGWLDDQDVPAPTRPVKHRLPDVERIAG
jgi:hypothetical protein